MVKFQRRKGEKNTFLFDFYVLEEENFLLRLHVALILPSIMQSPSLDISLEIFQGFVSR